MLNLSKHFIKNWIDRVDDNPGRVRVNKIIQKAVRFQKGKKMRTRFSFLKTLTVYIDWDMEVLITVDHYRNNIVPVFTRENMPDTETFGSFIEGIG